ncbi:uncharacterized protein LOC134209470 [Armigeres subalbatus]|uniref:uncharacterized protein LOC134209470 n=1 Tax=Armigeres subalbatus TaxID=124917 RepID=UPI002ED2CBB9
MDHGDARIISAHCDCAIGLLETCSHVNATLFALDDIRQKFLAKKISVTDLPAYWNKPPANVQGNLYKKIKEISFGRKIRRTWEPVLAPMQDRYANLLTNLQKEGVQVAAMHSFCGVDCFLCTSCKEANQLQNEFREYDLRNLFDINYRTMTKPELHALTQSAYNAMARDADKLLRITEMTMSPNQSVHWMVFRTGRITASVLRESCHTKISNPSISLIRKICYNKESSFQTAPMRYGKQNESRAYDQLYNSVAHCHSNSVKLQSGLIICPEYPFLGASPDGIIQCDCHGKITIEIKCPYAGKNNADFTDALLKMTDPYIIRTADGNIGLNPNHKYFYQALMQVHLANACFGYFFIWSPQKQYLFQIKRNDDFWVTCRKKASLFFQQVLLPELLYKAYTEPM